MNTAVVFGLLLLRLVPLLIKTKAMFRSMVLFVFVFALAFPAAAQIEVKSNSDIPNKTFKANSNKRDASGLTFEKKAHDFGLVEFESKAEARFEFTNRGKVPIIIGNVRPTCGCTAVKWPEEPVPPGGKASISLSYKTGKEGPFSEGAYVHWNGVGSPYRLSVMGEVATATGEVEVEVETPIQEKYQIQETDLEPAREEPKSNPHQTINIFNPK